MKILLAVSLLINFWFLWMLLWVFNDKPIKKVKCRDKVGYRFGGPPPC